MIWPALLSSFLQWSLGGFQSWREFAYWSLLLFHCQFPGSGYAYFYTLVGEFSVWFIGWNIEYAFSAAAIAGGWTNYLVTLFESLSANPAHLYNVPFDWNITGLIFKPASCNFIGFFVSEDWNWRLRRLTNAITISISPWSDFIIGRVERTSTASNWVLLHPEASGHFPRCWEMFFPYLGFDDDYDPAADSVNPSRDIPATILTITIATALYMSSRLSPDRDAKLHDLDDTNHFWLSLRSDANGRVYSEWLCALDHDDAGQFSLPWWTNWKYSKRWLSGMASPRQTGFNQQKSRPNARGNFYNNPDILLLVLFFGCPNGADWMISFWCLFCFIAFAVTLSNRFTRLEELNRNVPVVSLKRTGIAAIIIYYLRLELRQFGIEAHCRFFICP